MFATMLRALESLVCDVAPFPFARLGLHLLSCRSWPSDPHRRISRIATTRSWAIQCRVHPNFDVGQGAWSWDRCLRGSCGYLGRKAQAARNGSSHFRQSRQPVLQDGVMVVIWPAGHLFVSIRCRLVSPPTNPPPRGLPLPCSTTASGCLPEFQFSCCCLSAEVCCLGAGALSLHHA